MTLGQTALMTLKNFLKSGISQPIKRFKKMSQEKKMRVFKLTDSQLDLMLQSIKKVRSTDYKKLDSADRKNFDLMYQEVVEPYWSCYV